MNPPLHVLSVIDGLGRGGAEMLLSHFAGGAAPAGLRLSVAHLYDKDDDVAAGPLRSQGIEPVALRIGGLLAPSSFLRVREHVRAVQPDLVHTHLGYSDLLAGSAARSLGLACVSTIHLSRWDPAPPREEVKERLFLAARRRAARRVLAVSEAARAAYLQRGWDRPERVVTVHNGILDRPAPGTGVAVRRELGLSPADTVVTMLSVLRPGKGHAQAVQLAARLAPDHPGLRLLVVGDGPLREPLAREVRRTGAPVVLAGHRTDVMAVLDATDVLLHPSEHDAFPTTLLEAMAASVPVVATAVGGIPEIVVDGETGVLVPAPASLDDLHAALAPLLSDPARRGRTAAAGRARFLALFTAQRWAQRTRDVYEQVLADHAEEVSGRATPAARAAVATARRPSRSSRS